MGFDGSRALYERARRVIPSGVTSCMRVFQRPVPLFIDHGRGARVFDVDGNEYLDYMLAHGPLILGHCHPRLVAAVAKQLSRGSTFGCQHALEPLVAEQILSVLPWADQVVFSSTGTEAVQASLRLARAATGRNLIIKFEGDYHGWMDSILVAHRHKQPIRGPARGPELLGTEGQSPSILQDVLVLPWNDQQTAESVFSELGDRVAAAIAEPMQCNTASILPRAGFLERLCELTKRHGAALIFDEVITGFRLAAGGAAEYFGVEPDMAVYGKAVAGGYPLSAVAGTEAVMSAVASGRVRHFGTFNGNPIVMAAANATLEVLLDPAEDVYGRMRRLGSRLMDGLQGLSDGSLPMLVQGVPACFHLLFTEAREVLNYPGFLTCDTGHTQMWLENALLEGILQMGDARWYVSAAHTEQDIDITLERAGRILKRMASELSLSPVATG